MLTLMGKKSNKDYAILAIKNIRNGNGNGTTEKWEPEMCLYQKLKYCIYVILSLAFINKDLK